MAYEILKSIVEAEAHAEEIKRDAKKEAEAKKKAAEEKREEILLKGRQVGKDLLQSAAGEAVVQSRAEIIEINQAAEEACAKVREQAEQKKEAAIEAVIGKVVGTYGSR